MTYQRPTGLWRVTASFKAQTCRQTISFFPNKLSKLNYHMVKSELFVDEALCASLNFSQTLGGLIFK